jgi:transposase
MIHEDERHKKPHLGQPWQDPRAVFNSVLWILRAGESWQDLPERHPLTHRVIVAWQKWLASGGNRQSLELQSRFGKMNF